MGDIAKTVFISVVVAIALVLAACGGGGGGGAPATTTPWLTEATPDPGGCSFIGLNQPTRLLWPSVYLGKPGGALVRFHEGEPVPISFQVQSCGTEPAPVTYASSQRYDIAVMDDGGNEVWRWSGDKLFAQAIDEEAFGPYESVTFVETWDRRDNAGNPVPDGRYQVKAWITGRPAAGVQVWGCGHNDADCAVEASQTIALSP